MLDTIAVETCPGDEPHDLRGATTMIRSALREIVSTSIDAAVAAGQVRFSAALRSITLDPPDNDGK